MDIRTLTRSAIMFMALSAASSAAMAQTSTSAAQAAETKVAAPASAPAKTPEASWFARQWKAVVAMFSMAPERGRVPLPAAAANAPLPVVTISRPVHREIVEWDEYTGRFDAVDTIEVRGRVSGFLTSVHFTDGQMVNKGDLLFEIDSRPFERALDTAKAELMQTQTKVESSAKDVLRGRPLFDRRVISEKVLDDRENLKREAEAAVKVAEAKVQSAELDLSFTKIQAPLTGRISRNLLSIGNYVTGGGASNQSLLTTIVTQDPIQFYFDVSENNTLKYKRLSGSNVGNVGQPGATIEIALPDDKGFPHVGKLDFNDNRLDATTGTLRARAVIDNKSGLFSPGMFGRARIAGSVNYKAVLLPDDAIGTDQASKYVAVVADDGTVTRRGVTLGPIANGMRVVKTGLSPDEWVIIKGQQRARPGQKVNPKREPLQLSAAGNDGERTVKQ